MESLWGQGKNTLFLEIAKKWIYYHNYNYNYYDSFRAINARALIADGYHLIVLEAKPLIKIMSTHELVKKFVIAIQGKHNKFTFHLITDSEQNGLWQYHDSE